MKVEMSTGVGRDDRRSQTTQKLFVGNVADGTTDQQLRDLFEAHITVVEADVIDNKNFGFVHVDLGVSANSRDGRNKLDEILNQVGGAELNGNRLILSFWHDVHLIRKSGAGKSKLSLIISLIFFLCKLFWATSINTLNSSSLV